MLAYVEYMFTREQSSKANILAKCKNSTFIIAGQEMAELHKIFIKKTYQWHLKSSPNKLFSLHPIP